MKCRINPLTFITDGDVLVLKDGRSVSVKMKLAGLGGPGWVTLDSLTHRDVYVSARDVAGGYFANHRNNRHGEMAKWGLDALIGGFFRWSVTMPLEVEVTSSESEAEDREWSDRADEMEYVLSMDANYDDADYAADMGEVA